jgi:hypothetical protein
MACFAHVLRSPRRESLRLLIVEDSALIRKVTRLAFPQTSHELHEAANGRQALVVATSEPESSDPFRQARAMNVGAIVKKPWKPQELAAMVQGVVQTARAKALARERPAEEPGGQGPA